MLTHHRIVLLVEGTIHILLVVVGGVLGIVRFSRETTLRRVILSLLLTSRRGTLRFATGDTLLWSITISHASHLVVFLRGIRHSGKILIEVGSVSISHVVSIRGTRILVGESIDGIVRVSLGRLGSSSLREFARGIITTRRVVLRVGSTLELALSTSIGFRIIHALSNEKG